jgi:hypothetical protein
MTEESEAWHIQMCMVDKYGLQSVTPITNAPLRFESHQWFGAFLKCTGNVPPTLAGIEAGWEHVGE